MDLPSSTAVSQRVPKAAFFANLTLAPAERRALTVQVDSICWRNKLAPDTLHISPGQQVLELQVFELRLSDGTAECTVLDALDEQLPYHLLFLIVKGGQIKASIACKRANPGDSHPFTVLARFETDWMPPDALSLPLQGMDMDAVYEAWVKEIAGDALEVRPGEGLCEALQRMRQRQTIAKKIAQLEKKAWSEKQPKKRFELVQEIMKLNQTLTQQE